MAEVEQQPEAEKRPEAEKQSGAEKRPEAEKQSGAEKRPEIERQQDTQLVCPKYRIFISTGEVSGDLQGALLIEALQRQAQSLGVELEILALGGNRMAEAGATLLANTSAIGSIGLFESLPYISSTLKIQRQVKRKLQQLPPDLLVMIDYFGPNLGIGNFVGQRFPQIPKVYYIAPQEWVWSVSQRNTERILAMSDQLLAIFPAEARYYAARGGKVTWIGHPLLDWLQTAPRREAARSDLQLEPNQLMVALIPASRPQELKYVLPTLFAAAQQIQTQLPQVQFLIPLSLERYRQSIQQAIQQFGLNATLAGSSEAVIAAADLVIAKSGTVNLETALLEVPQVVLYRINPLTAWIAEHLLKFSAPFISPPNLVMMQPIVPEFLQHQATPTAIAEAALRLLQDPEQRNQMRSNYRQMRQQLGEVGVCDRAAATILQLLRRSQPQKSSCF